MMASFSKVFQHGLGQEEAVRRIRERIAIEKNNRANVANVTREVWDPFNVLDFSMIVFKFRIDGTLQIENNTMELTLKLPLGAKVFAGMIEDQITQQINALLN
ncbi:MAG: polyhydroxyalkanoic acid system family protein [Thermoguttaceae bacterium]|nr:polyhydroxyalkanoic acid system family protein [Thermoguttaceae bacterium]